jgi:hypothetical protein
LPWRKFTCDCASGRGASSATNPLVRGRQFAERFTELLPRYGRRTNEATGLLLAFAQRAGVKLERESREPRGCPPVQIRCVVLREQEFTVNEAPPEVGVDQFALHRRPLGYGLLLVDLAIRRPIDVLPDDESATLAGWLREHPGAKVVARHRGLRIRDGVRLGAPTPFR